MHIRRSTYIQAGQPISLAFLTCLADQHPEHIEAPPPPPQPPALARAQRQSRWGEKLTRRRDREARRMARARNLVGYQAALRRIDSGGV